MIILINKHDNSNNNNTNTTTTTTNNNNDDKHNNHTARSRAALSLGNVDAQNLPELAEDALERRLPRPL